MRRIVLATALLTTLSCAAIVDLKPVQASGASVVGRGLGKAGQALVEGEGDLAGGLFLIFTGLGGLGILSYYLKHRESA